MAGKKYIITESQLKQIISESSDLWLRRRWSQIQEAISFAISQFLPCEFSDEFEYADNVISFAYAELESLIDISSLPVDNDVYTDAQDFMIEMLKDEFGEELLEVYVSNCSEEDDY